MHLHGHHTRAFQRCVIAIGLAAVLLVLLTSGAWANQSAGWTPCECDENQYTLAVNTSGGQGTISVSPQKDYYSKGELVIVTVTPGQDARFVKWQSVPPSHTAHESHYETVPLFITGNTQLTANLAPKHYTLTVNWNTARGAVALPPGAQGGNGQFTVEAEYGETLTLTSTPYGGRHPKWRGTVWAGYRYGSNVTVRVTGTLGLEAEFDDQAPNLIYGMSMSIAAGAAHISCAYDNSGAMTGGSYDYTAAVGPSNLFAYRVREKPGYSFNYVTWFAGGANRYTTESMKSNRAGRDYSVHLSSNVNLIVETEGQGVVTSPHFKAGYNPRPYEQALYTQPAPTSLTPITNGNPVTMTPVPCPGWAFDHWEYKNANNEWVAVENPIPGYPSNITVYMNWWTGAGIHVPENQSGLPVKAVFVERGVDISLYATFEGCFQGYAQRLTGSNSYAFTSGEQVLEALQQATSQHCAIGNLFILSHAWIFNSISGQVHGGGFYSDYQLDNGFYGASSEYDLPAARYLSDLQTAINNGNIKFADNPNLRVFLEGCRIGETGSTIAIPSSFVSGLAGITGRPVVAACGGSSEEQLTPTSVKFLSAPGGTLELNDGRYDGWIENGSEEGRYCTVPSFFFEN